MYKCIHICNKKIYIYFLFFSKRNVNIWQNIINLISEVTYQVQRNSETTIIFPVILTLINFLEKAFSIIL